MVSIPVRAPVSVPLEDRSSLGLGSSLREVVESPDAERDYEREPGPRERGFKLNLPHKLLDSAHI